MVSPPGSVSISPDDIFTIMTGLADSDSGFEELKNADAYFLMIILGDDGDNT